MILAPKLLKAIDLAWERDEDPRGYLGASGLGSPCSRALWYGFRWAARPAFPPRVLRLFDRGNREEEVFEKLLADAGVQYWPHDPATGEQYLVQFKNKHLGGHTDGQGKGLPDLDPDELFVGEFKTHNDKSFKDLVKHGVEKSKPVHYTQMQLYIHQLNIPWALYGAVNKNDDQLYFEIIPYDEEAASYYLRRGDYIVDACTPPERLSNNPGWYECKWCDFYRVCHTGKPMDETCRSCQHVRPVVSGEWWCGLHDKLLQKSEQLAGCQDYVAIQQED